MFVQTCDDVIYISQNILNDGFFREVFEIVAIEIVPSFNGWNSKNNAIQKNSRLLLGYLSSNYLQTYFQQLVELPRSWNF